MEQNFVHFDEIVAVFVGFRNSQIIDEYHSDFAVLHFSASFNFLARVLEPYLGHQVAEAGNEEEAGAPDTRRTFHPGWDLSLGYGVLKSSEGSPAPAVLESLLAFPGSQNFFGDIIE